MESYPSLLFKSEQSLRKFSGLLAVINKFGTLIEKLIFDVFGPRLTHVDIL